MNWESRFEGTTSQAGCYARKLYASRAGGWRTGPIWPICYGPPTPSKHTRKLHPSRFKQSSTALSDFSVPKKRYLNVGPWSENFTRSRF